MHYKRIKYYIFLFFAVTVIGCSPIKEIETETLQPANISFPKHFQRIGFFFSYPENDFELVNKENFKEDVIEELKIGIAEITTNSPRFLPDDILLYNISEFETYLKKDTLDIASLDHIADSLLLDGLIILHDFTLDSRLENEYNSYSEEYYLNFKITSKADWKIYDKYGNKFIDSFSYKEQYVWDALARTKQEALVRMPDYDDTFLEAAYWTGHDYASRAFPVWEKNERVYYARGNDIMKSASEKVENNNWKEAITLWKRNLSHYDDELVSRTAYNIAIAFEMMGKIDLAIKWAQKAYEINSKKRALEYYKLLKERKEELSELDEQLP